MDMNTETRATKPAGFPKKDAPQAFREMAEKGTTQAKETYEKAIQFAFQQLQVNPKLAPVTGDLALYYAKNGDPAHALQYIRQARSIDASDLQLMYYQVQIYTLAEKQAEALSTLREAFQKGYSTEEALNDPELGKLKSLPEFARLVNEFSKKKTN